MFLTVNYPKIRHIDSKISILKFNINPIYLELSEKFYHQRRLNLKVNTSKFIMCDNINENGIRVSSR